MDSFLKFHIVYVCFSHIEIHIHYGILTIYPVTSLNLLINSNNLALFLCVSYIHNYICQHGSIISLFSVIILLLLFFFVLLLFCFVYGVFLQLGLIFFLMCQPLYLKNRRNSESIRDVFSLQTGFTLLLVGFEEH